MRKWLVCVLGVLLIFPAGVQAQNTVILETVNVSLWSEYDQPSMLVMYDFSVAAETPLPATVKMRVPRDGNITAVAYQGSNGWLNAEFAGPTEEGHWQIVEFFIKERITYHLEYYQPIERTGNERSFKYYWPGTYPVNNFHIEIQVPEDGTAVKSSPMLPFAPNQPFLSSSASLDNLEAGETYQINLHYARTSEETIIPSSSTPVIAAEPIAQNTTGRITLERLPYILGGVGLLLIIGAGYYFWQMQATETPKLRKRSEGKGKGEAGLSNIHCHECGTRAHTEDRFCRVCGTKLRIN